MSTKNKLLPWPGSRYFTRLLLNFDLNETELFSGLFSSPNLKANPGRAVALVAMLGCLWGIVEIQLGTLLQSLGAPFRGALLAGIAVVILEVGRVFVGRRGSAIAIGFTVAFLKMLFIGSLAFYPAIAIFIESIIVELALWTFSPRRRHFLFAGVFAVSAMLFFPFFSQGVLGGWKIVDVYLKLVAKTSIILGLEGAYSFVIIAVFLIFYALFGMFAGALAMSIIKLLARRLAAYPSIAISANPSIDVKSADFKI